MQSSYKDDGLSRFVIDIMNGFENYCVLILKIIKTFIVCCVLYSMTFIEHKCLLKFLCFSSFDYTVVLNKIFQYILEYLPLVHAWEWHFKYFKNYFCFIFCTNYFTKWLVVTYFCYLCRNPCRFTELFPLLHILYKLPHIYFTLRIAS